MIESVGSSGSSGFLGPGALGKEDFLRLLVTQLQYQDPLDPLDAQDFASQLAEFTSMEQQLITNELLEAQIEMNSAAMVESQNSVAIGLVGKGVVTPGDQVEVAGDGSDAAYIATTGAATVRLELLDEQGEVVLSMQSTVTKDGAHRVELGSAAEDLEAGVYTLSVEVIGAEEGVTATSLSSGVARGVRWGDNGPVLVVGNEEVPLINILEITN